MLVISTVFSNHLHQCVSVRRIEEEGMAVRVGGGGDHCEQQLQEEILLSKYLIS